MFVAIVQLGDLFPRFGEVGGGGSNFKVTSLTDVNFERKPLKVSGSYFVGVAQFIVTPNGYIS